MAGWSQFQLGVHAGLTTKQVQMYESGVTTISITALYRIAHALNLPMGYFVKQMDKVLKLPPARRAIAMSADLEKALDMYLSIPDGMHKVLYEFLTGLVKRGRALM
ncbi:MAG: helix-turn-helix transcriptional regulator [Rhodospirillaceae bacterium]|nr:helix-turn-helix transcriptional regulator [Rhodospirillales bacterium]